MTDPATDRAQLVFRRPPHRGNLRLILLLTVLLCLFSGSALVSYYVNALWFDSLGYGTVFWQRLCLQWGIFGAAALLTLAIVYAAYRLMTPAGLDQAIGGRILVNRQWVPIRIEPVLRWLAPLLAAVIAMIAGSTLSAHWNTFAMWWRAPADVTAAEPIFGHSLRFYFFELPLWQLLAGWLMSLALLSGLFALALVAAVRHSSSAAANQARNRAWRGLCVAVAAVLTVQAVRVYLNRFDRLFQDGTVFSGVGFTDAHVILGGMLAVSAALLLGAVLALICAFSAAEPRRLIACAAPAAACYGVVALVGWYVGNFIVKPNQLVKERPYISHNIAMTRRAYALDRIEPRPFPAETGVDAIDQANNQPTLQNIRLWDWRALQDTLRQIQEIRTYYDFPDIDIDRYQLGGVTRQMMLATRELNVDKLPDSSRNWINEKLVYTHGYGVTMNPVNGFTAEGLPTLLLSNMPIQSTVPELQVHRPEIYFGELTDTDVYVKTRQKEFNYPQGDINNLTSYEGEGGIRLGGWLRRTLIAYDRGDLWKLPFSDDIGADSRLLMRRNIRERVQELAPFLTLDPDPYVVVGDDGRIYWMMDAFTTSNNYPYARRYQVGDQQLNYMRNSVKIVVDAYTGAATFYVYDQQDPIIAAYRAIFPALFRDGAAMPPGLRQHVRYPELLLDVQAAVYGLYHMSDPDVFYNREDLWTVASQVGLSDQRQQVMEPNFVLMNLPGERNSEFIEILPFTPANRNNLIGWIAGRSDGEHYGQALVYDFPKTKLIDGPLQVEARIDQNADLSSRLTLWNQQGSRVIRGSLIVIPVGKALLYAEPIYLQANRSPMPELRLVVLAVQDRLAYGPTFETAMAALFSGANSSTTATATANPPATVAAAGAATAVAVTDQSTDALISEAAHDLADYQQLTAAGKLGEAGQKLEQLKIRLEQLQRRRP